MFITVRPEANVSVILFCNSHERYCFYIKLSSILVNFNLRLDRHYVLNFSIRYTVGHFLIASIY